MTCKYCGDKEVFVFRDEYSLLELMISSNNKSLEVHHCGEATIIDYDNGEVNINFCPWCGKKL